MRLTTVILIASLMQVSAAGFAQRVTLNHKNTTLQQVFKEIRRQSGYALFYDARILPKNHTIDIAVKDASVEEALSTAIKGLPLSFEITGRGVLIKKKEEATFLENIIARFQTIDVRGRVLNEQNEPLAGATVSVKDGSKQVKTDAQGNFYLYGVDEKAVLVISYVGFRTTEIGAKEDLGLLILKLEDNSLEQVQVIAYGQVEKRFSTSNIGVVKAEEIQRQPVSNPILALAGRVPGVFIRQRSGVSATDIAVNIQGTNSLQNSNDPFYVIDGVPYSSSFSVSLAEAATNGSGSNPLNFINPADIESISILKDADATAIYGSRAANGAILITTKRGKQGVTSFNINLQNGWGKITRKADLVNTEDYLELRKERYINDGLQVPTSNTPPTNSNYDLTYWNQNKYTDLQELLLGGTAKYTDLQGSVSGGSSNTQFLASYGYHNETTVYPADFYDRKGNVRLTLNHRSTDSRFKYSLTGSYLQQQNTLSNLDLAGVVTQLAPNVPDLTKPDGSLNFVYLANNTTNTFANPLTSTKERYTGKSGNLIANNLISYEIFKGLEIKTTFGFKRLEGEESLLRPTSYYHPNAVNKTRRGSYLIKDINTWIAEPQLTYKRNTKYGVLDILLGGSFQQSKTEMLRQSASGYATDASLPDITSATTRTIDAVEYDLYRYTAAFGRINYRLRDKYILNFNLRRDGSSRFGPESRFNTFYAIGGAWLFGDEHFIKSALPWLSFAKLRGSYGTTGNDQIGNYRYLSLLDVYTGAEIPYQNGLSLQVNKIDNPFLQWEETRKLNFGMELGFLDNRILFDLTYAKNRSSNQLIAEILPRITGASAIDVNLPALVQNVSYEAQLTVVPVRKDHYRWDISANITVPINNLLSFPGIEESTYNSSYIIGQPLSIKRLYRFGGVNSQTGLYQYYTSNGELTSSPNSKSDRILTTNVDPIFYGGISNGLSYKGFRLDFLIQFVKQTGALQRFSNGYGFMNEVPLKSILGRWQKQGDITDIQKISQSNDAITAARPIGESDASFGDVSFIRLKNAALSYSLPNSVTSKTKMGNARVYVQGQNLLTFTNYYGSDPETPSGVLPPLKMLTIGLQVTF